MLIVCPSCATSYMIDTASLGAGGRMVRCARCKATWLAGGPQEQVSAFVDEVIAEAEAEAAEPEPFLRAPAGEVAPPPTLADDFSVADAEEAISEAEPESAPFPEEPFPEEPALTAAHSTPAEPQSITDSPSLVPPMEQEAPPAEAEPEPPAGDIESFAARRRRLKSRRKRAKRSSRWTAIILVLLTFNLALIMGRSEVVRILPQTASLFAAIGLPVNLRQLKFESVRISPNGNGLVVEGNIVSTASTPVKVPVLRFAVRNAAGQEIYIWTRRPMRSMLDPGDKLAFRSELASPPPDAKDVLVRFLTAQEAADMAVNNPDGKAKPGKSGGDH